MRFGRDTWSLILPDAWRAWHDDECSTLVDDQEIGALQISAAFKDCEVLERDLADFALEHLDAGAEAHPTQVGDFVGFEIAFSDETGFWRQWYLRHGRQMLFVTYNCSLESRGSLDDEVQGALATLLASGDMIA